MRAVWPLIVVANAVHALPKTAITSATSATLNAPHPTMTYAVYPSNGTNAKQVDSIASQLKDIVTDPASIYSSITQIFGLNYWTLPLDQDAAKKVQNIPGVATTWLDCGDTCPEDDPCFTPCYDPTTSLVYDDLSWATHAKIPYLTNEILDAAKQQLTYLSWPSSERQAPDRFIFDNTAGAGVKVYILDTGANLGKTEFAQMRDRVLWIPENAPRDDGTNGNRLEGFHGTAMLSVVAGNTLGIAKNIVPVVVRFPTPTWRMVNGIEIPSVLSPQQYIAHLSMINDNLGTGTSSKATCVVLLAQYYPRSRFPNNDPGAWESRFYQLLLQLVSKGAVIVTGSSNLLRGQTIDGWPANFGKTALRNGFTRVPELIVAGAITGNGEAVVFASDIDVPHVYAPGVNVIVANGNPNYANDYKSSQGTSDAAAYVAGLAAYYIRLAQDGLLKRPDGSVVENSPQGIKDFIVNQADGNPAGSAWSRMKADGQDRPGIFNSIDINEKQCPYDPGTSVSQTCVTGPGAPPPVQPLTIQSVVCHNASNFPGHGDISGGSVKGQSTLVCYDWRNEKIGPGDKPLSSILQADEINYEYDVEWVSGCVTTLPEESVFSPLALSKQQCAQFFYDCWKNCTTNTGVGGYVDVGCLRYTFTGGKGNS